MEKVEYGEFYAQTDIESFDFSNIAEVGESAFASSSIQQIEGVINNPDRFAFSACEDLKGNITIAGNHVGNASFERCPQLESVVLEDGVESVGAYAFDECISLESVRVPSDLKKIGEYAFSQCAVTSIDISNVEEIGSRAFWECDKLEEVVIKNLEGKIASNIFEGCASLKTLTINGMTLMNLNDSQKFVRIDKEGKKFYIIYEEYGQEKQLALNNLLMEYIEDRSQDSREVSGDIEVDMPELPDRKVRKSEELTSVKLLSGVEKIGDNTFDKCSKLHSVEFPETLAYIGDSAFQDTDIREADLSDSKIEKLSGRAFHVCRNLSDIKLPEGLKEIEYFALAGCTSLGEITVPDSVERIGKGAFSRDLSLKHINIPDSLSEIPEYMLMGCPNLEELIVKDNVKRIKEKAFSLTGIKSLRLPEGIAISDDILKGCIKLKSLIIGEREVISLSEEQIFEGLTKEDIGDTEVWKAVYLDGQERRETIIKGVCSLERKEPEFSDLQKAITGFSSREAYMEACDRSSQEWNGRSGDIDRMIELNIEDR